MSKRRDEQTKYLATLVNTCAASSFTLGVLAPIAAAFYGAKADVPIQVLILGAFIWLCAAQSLHLSVQRILGGLPDDEHSGFRLPRPAGRGGRRGLGCGLDIKPA